ncbi:hypothetical protein ASE63_18520 [Bosea sp. Root381]|uniref:hypothetical protein n=1 Tax=Bosea sp. Root381 TaxID=1736524 RepID=UPI0007001260|nr:hypothetical protein [Bosea sp. Root381]KRE13468.1 hypothetical protein ASE63_18520 [Bosea sp. Root381]
MGDDVALLILAELRAVNARLDRLDQAGFAVPPAHRLVSAIGEHTNGLPFTVRELIRHGEQAEPALLGAIEGACGRVSARGLGKKLAKLAAAPIAGYRVESMSEERTGRVWKVEKLLV